MRPTSMYLFVIFSISFLLTILVLATGWEVSLVSTLHEPKDAFSWWMRNYGKYPAIIVSVIAVLFMLTPYLRNKSAILRRIAITWLVALIFGAGLIGGWITVEGFDRPRPRETVLLEGQEAYTPPFVVSEAEQGKSFTSGHAAMGFIFAAPFFALRRRYPKTAFGFLVGGLIFGSALGYTRMVLGAHFITDIIWSAAFVLAAAALGNALWKDGHIIKSRYTITFLAAIAILIAYFNSFERTLHFQESATGHLQLNMACDVIHINSDKEFSAKATINGYGAPTKALKLVNIEGILTLKATGLFRDIHCSTATITVPPTKTIGISKGQHIEMGKKPLFLVQTTDTHRIFSGENAKND